eukprot:1522847-Pyramimonas_sp.AAC.1
MPLNKRYYIPPQLASPQLQKGVVLSKVPRTRSQLRRRHVHHADTPPSRYMPPPYAPLAPHPGICPLPTHHWSINTLVTPRAPPTARWPAPPSATSARCAASRPLARSSTPRRPAPGAPATPR